MNRENLQREARRPGEQSRERADVVKECGGRRGSALLVLTGFATESSRSRRAPKGGLCPICSLIAWVTSSLPALSPVSMSCTRTRSMPKRNPHEWRPRLASPCPRAAMVKPSTCSPAYAVDCSERCQSPDLPVRASPPALPHPPPLPSPVTADWLADV